MWQWPSTFHNSVASTKPASFEMITALQTLIWSKTVYCTFILKSWVDLRQWTAYTIKHCKWMWLNQKCKYNMTKLSVMTSVFTKYLHIYKYRNSEEITSFDCYSQCFIWVRIHCLIIVPWIVFIVTATYLIGWSNSNCFMSMAYFCTYHQSITMNLLVNLSSQLSVVLFLTRNL